MLDAVTTPQGPEPVVVGGMPEGVPPAALQPEPKLPAPAGWPFGEEFPHVLFGRAASFSESVSPSG
jgi:hypothetical protein